MTMPFVRARRRSRAARLALWFVPLLALVAALLPASMSNAAPSIAPTGFTVAVTANNTGFGPAAPKDVLADTDTDITLTLTTQPAGATFNSSVVVNLGVCFAAPDGTCASTPSPTGSLSATSVTFPSGTTSKAYTVRYSAAESGLLVTAIPARLTGATKSFTTAYSAPFQILGALTTTTSSDPTLLTGFGASDCTGTTTTSVCGIVTLPNGISSTMAALGSSPCTTNLNCTPGSQLIHFYAGMAGKYTPTTPASVAMRCDKTQCPGGGVNAYTLKASFSPTGDLVNVPACLVKGVADGIDASGAHVPYCTDYVSSSRDNAGDTILIFLFVDDVRITY